MEPNKNEIGEIFFAMALAGIANNSHVLTAEKAIEHANRIAELSLENAATREKETEATADKRNIFYALLLTGCSSQVHVIGPEGVVEKCKKLSDLAIQAYPAQEGTVELDSENGEE